MNVYDTLSRLGITLPPVATPAAAYVPFARTGNLVFLSGHIARRRTSMPIRRAPSRSSAVARIALPVSV